MVDLLPFITFLINKSLSSGEVPSAFKTARVLPVLKKPTLDSSDANNYRPNQLQARSTLDRNCSDSCDREAPISKISQSVICPDSS
ncbi:hypothetical protein AOLI_G00170560 [Acnodon oligacanthus]